MVVVRHFAPVLGQYVLTALLLAGLLSVPVHCSLVDHPHSIFDSPRPRAMTMPMDRHLAHDAGGLRGRMPGMAAVPSPDRLPVLIAEAATWSVGQSSAASRFIVDVAGRFRSAAPEASALPVVNSATITMLASSLSALNALLALLLMGGLLAVRPLPVQAPSRGRPPLTLAPPPRVIAPV